MEKAPDMISNRTIYDLCKRTLSRAEGIERRIEKLDGRLTAVIGPERYGDVLDALQEVRNTQKMLMHYCDMIESTAGIMLSMVDTINKALEPEELSPAAKRQSRDISNLYDSSP